MPNPIINRRLFTSSDINNTPSFIPEAQTLFDAMSSEPTLANKIVYNYAIKNYLVDTGDWTEIDVFWVPYVGTGQGAQAAALNWKNPGVTFTLNPVNFVTFNDLGGWVGDGATTYIDTTWNASTNGVKYVLDSASFFFFLKDNVGDVLQQSGGNTATRFVYIVPRTAGDLGICNINDAGAGHTGTITDSRGLIGVQRTGANSIDLLQNGVIIANSVLIPSTAIPSISQYLGARNNNGTPAFNMLNTIQAGGFGSSAVNQLNVYNCMVYLKANLT